MLNLLFFVDNNYVTTFLCNYIMVILIILIDIFYYSNIYVERSQIPTI